MTSKHETIDTTSGDFHTADVLRKHISSVQTVYMAEHKRWPIIVYITAEQSELLRKTSLSYTEDPNCLPPYSIYGSRIVVRPSTTSSVTVDCGV